MLTNKVILSKNRQATGKEDRLGFDNDDKIRRPDDGFRRDDGFGKGRDIPQRRGRRRHKDDY